MDLRLEYLSPAQMRVMAKTLMELADIEERERAQDEAKEAEWRSLRFSRPATEVLAAEPAEPAEAPKKRASKAASAAPAAEPPAAPPAATEQTPAAPSDKTVTLTELRAKLAQLSRDGKADQVKTMLAQFNAAKLTDLTPDVYGAAMAAAHAL